jgi:hypothetical protein
LLADGPMMAEIKLPSTGNHRLDWLIMLAIVII